MVNAIIGGDDGSLSGGSGGSALQSVTVTITSAQLLNIQATPVQIVAAPGTGKIIVPDSTTYVLKFGTTAYTGDGSGLWWGQSVSADTTGNGVFSSSADAIQQSFPYSSANYSTQGFFDGLIENVPILLWSPNSALTGGDGTGIILFNYYVLNVGS